MRFMHGAVVDAPRREVFAWHSRPGALARLLPPWQPVQVQAEAESLSDGQAVLVLPGGVKWVARHQPDVFDPPHRFADELVSEPLRTALRWRHLHEFDELGATATRVTDTVDTTLPSALLRPMFAYRQRQLDNDLAAHRWARTLAPQPLRVAITGSSGLIGTALAAFLTTGGHDVIRLVRGVATRPDERHWQPDAPDPGLFQGVDAVVHLAGASIAGRFTAAHKQAIRDSRVGPTADLAAAVAQAGSGSEGPRCLITASAVGFYGPDRGDELLTEGSDRGAGFLADVVADWEQAATGAEQGGVRVVQVRTGIVQSPRGGTLRLLRPLFTAGLGGRLAGGTQWTPWIGIDDLVGIYHRALVDTSLSGPVNAAAPHPVRNAEYTATLARVLRRPAVVPVPRLGPQLLLGTEGARELAEAGQRVQPERLLRADHVFRDPELEPALRHLLGKTGRGQ